MSFSLSAPTLGNAALRVLADLLGLPAIDRLAPDPSVYGRRITLASKAETSGGIRSAIQVNANANTEWLTRWKTAVSRK
jgi:hypothetical protein